jgi:hypothetical protein
MGRIKINKFVQYSKGGGVLYFVHDDTLVVAVHSPMSRYCSITLKVNPIIRQLFSGEM